MIDIRKYYHHHHCHMADKLASDIFHILIKKVKCAILLLEFRRGAHLPN